MTPERHRNIEEFSASAVRSTAETKMIAESQGFCYVSQVQGPFKGGGEYVRVTRRDGYWWLQVGAGREAENRAVEGKAICVDW